MEKRLLLHLKFTKQAVYNHPMSKKIYQFKIVLKDTKPPVWRRIQVPEDYSFWDLHITIQDAMGWMDCHMHGFELPNPAKLAINSRFAYAKGTRIGTKMDEDLFDTEMLDEQTEKIKKWFSLEECPKAEHWIILEKILPSEEGQKYPVCLKGKRQCPPEDCGGVWGFDDICKGKHHAQEHYKHYDPHEEFDPAQVIFDDPKERWEETKELL